MAATEATLRKFFQSPQYAVVGASTNTQKYGFKVFRWYVDHNLPVTPVNPTSKSIPVAGVEHPTVASLSELEKPTETGISFITPPPVTLKTLKEAKELGVPSVFLQPGTYNDEVLRFAEENFQAVVVGDASATPEYHTLPALREQAKIRDGWTRERRDAIPSLLQKHGVDAWLVSQKEYAEDTAFWSLKSAEEFSARRRTTTLFLANSSTGKNSYTWVDISYNLWNELREVLDTENPKTIAVNDHPQIAFASGLHAGELDTMRDGLGKGWTDRFVSKPMVAVEYIATMPASRAEWYHRLQSTAWAVISEAFSEKVIEPGVTTTKDVEWWMRDKLQQLNYTTWFHPDVTIVDNSSWNFYTDSPPATTLDDTEEADPVINHGDMLHVDFGVTALGLNTDTQHLAYVLGPGETEADIPQGLIDGLRKGNRAQDIVVSHMEVGKTGTEILKAALDQMKSEGIEGRVYSHPIGDWGHSAGTLIGMTNAQDGVPVLGDLPLLSNTYYSIELLVRHFVAERNETWSFPLEEDITWDFDQTAKSASPWKWAFGRQEKFHLIRSQKSAHSGTGEKKHGAGTFKDL